MKKLALTITLLTFAILAGCGGNDDGGSGGTTPTDTPTTVASPTPTAENTATNPPAPTATATATPTETETPTPSPSPTTTMSLTVHFRARVGDEPFICGRSYENIGTPPSTLPAVADLRLYVSDIRLMREDGEEVPLELDQSYKPWQLDDVALLDFEDKTAECFAFGTTPTNDLVVGSVPTAEYTGIKFVLGVPFDKNHGNQITAPDPLSLETMFWSWQSGYKFLRIDTLDIESNEEFRIHLGSTGCHGSPPAMPVTSCDRPNRAEVDLADFDPASDAIIIDLASLLADSDVAFNTEGTAPGCQSDPSDPDCDPIFANLGLSREDGASDPAEQKLFRVEKTDLEHAEIFVGSTEQGGGKLSASLAFEGPLGLFFNECLDGEGDLCEDGTILYNAVTPGVEPIEEDDPEAPRYKLEEAANVKLEITAIETAVDGAMLSLQLDQQLAGAVGESIDVGAGDFHADITTQLLLPGGSDHNLAPFSMSFRLVSDSTQYEPSDEFTVHFVALDEAGGDHHDE